MSRNPTPFLALVTPGLFSCLWDFLSAIWAAAGSEPSASSPDDTGSGLDPNG